MFGKFFEDLKEDKLQVKNENIVKPSYNLDSSKVGLYVITFNSPNQFRTLIDSMIAYDKDYLNKTKKFLLDNSTDKSTFDQYQDICEEFGFEHIVPEEGNLGICGGRQFIAEHFDKSGLDYMHFFEDDMFFHPKDGVCRNGFNRFVPNFYQKTLEIIKKENFLPIKFYWSWNPTTIMDSTLCSILLNS